ncbi:hypothetical protein BH23CHL7_BH23CHL7_16810 [soil metagenome]
MTEMGSEPARRALQRAVQTGVLDAQLGGLLLVLGEHGVPLVVASRDLTVATLLGQALVGLTGTLSADSFEEVVRLAGGSAETGVPDELRDMGIVVVTRALEDRPRVVAAHYVRPLERDAGGHVQRRGPAVLATWDAERAEWEHFAWGVAAELAERAGLPLAEFEAERERRVASLAAAMAPENGG